MLKPTVFATTFLLNTLALLVLGGNLYARDVCRIAEGTWTEADNPYNATCSLLVPEGKALTIEEGVKLFLKKDSGIKVKGNLYIKGSESKKVIFTVKGKANEQWNGIEVEGDKSTLEIKNCIVDHSSFGIKESSDNNKIVIEKCNIKSGGISLRSSESKIINNEIKSNINLENGEKHYVSANKIFAGGISISYGSYNNLIENNSIEGGNGDGIYTGSHTTNYWNAPPSTDYSDGNKIIGNSISKKDCGIDISGGADNSVSNNLIKNNKNEGIMMSGGTITNNTIVGNGNCGIRVNGATKINNNEIYGNIKGELINDSSSEIDATNNWWGTTNEQIIISKIVDYFQDSKKGIVKFQPYLNEKPKH